MEGWRLADLFCGVGGFRAGLEPLGVSCVYSCDIDPTARKWYHAFFGDEPSANDGDNVLHLGWEAVLRRNRGWDLQQTARLPTRVRTTGRSLRQGTRPLTLTPPARLLAQ